MYLVNKPIQKIHTSSIANVKKHHFQTLDFRSQKSGMPRHSHKISLRNLPSKRYELTLDRLKSKATFVESGNFDVHFQPIKFLFLHIDALLSNHRKRLKSDELTGRKKLRILRNQIYSISKE